MKLRAYDNVYALGDLAEERRERQRAADESVRLQFVGWRTTTEMLTPSEIQSLRQEAKETSAYARKAFAHLRPPSHPAAQALVAGLMLGMAQRENDPALPAAGKRLAEAAQKGQRGAPRGRWRANRLLAFLGLGERGRPS